MSLQKEIDLVWEESAKTRDLLPLLTNNEKYAVASIEAMYNRELRFIDKDYYVFKGKGGLKIQETPKGVKKSLARIARAYNLSVVILDGVIRDGDEISSTSDGTIETVSIVKGTASLTGNGKIISPYAVVSVYKDSVMITRKLFIVPADEYQTIKRLGGGNAYESMMAQKSVMKRVANGIYSLLGVTLNREHIQEVDSMGENMRVDDELPEEVTPVDTIAEMKATLSDTDLLDKDAVASAKAKLTALYSQEVNANRKEEIKIEGLKLNKVLEEIDALN